VQILGSQVPVTCPVVAVPSIDHDHTVSSAQEEQSEQTSAAVAPGGVRREEDWCRDIAQSARGGRDRRLR
jgi:hypothetical protein